MKRRAYKTLATALAAIIATSAMVLPASAETDETIGTSIGEPPLATDPVTGETALPDIVIEDVIVDYVSPTTYSGIQPYVLADGRVAWLKWSRKPNEPAYSGYWVDDVKVAETKEEFDQWIKENVKPKTEPAEPTKPEIKPTIGSSSDSDNVSLPTESGDFSTNTDTEPTIGTSGDDKIEGIISDKPAFIIKGETITITVPAISGVLVYKDGSMLINGQHVNTIDGVLMLEVDGIYVPAVKIGNRYFPIDDIKEEENRKEDVSDNVVTDKDENESEQITPVPDISYPVWSAPVVTPSVKEEEKAEEVVSEIVDIVATSEEIYEIDKVYTEINEDGEICYFVLITINEQVMRVELTEELWSLIKGEKEFLLETKEGYDENGEYIVEYYYEGVKVDVTEFTE